MTSALVNERNWNEVIGNIPNYPFRVSELNSLHKEIPLTNVSFKYTIQGKEMYQCNGKEVTLHNGEYLISINNQVCEVHIDEEENKDLGICIDINPDFLLRALQGFLEPNNLLSYSDKLCFFLQESSFVKYKSNREFHRYMCELFSLIKSDTVVDFSELQHEFVKQFLFHQTAFMTAYKKVPVVKQSTRNELFAKMIEAKNRLHDSVYQNISISELSKSLFLSEYRFYHLFKETFLISPHKYLTQLKLNESLTLFRSRQYTWTEIAGMLQFADLQSFSKMFKKNFRMSPSEYAHKVIRRKSEGILF